MVCSTWFSLTFSCDLSDKVYRVPPRIIRLKERVVQVACGENHTLLLTNNAEVYSA